MKNNRLVYQGEWSFSVRKDFVLNPSISVHAKMLYIAIKSYCSPDGETSFPSAETLSEGLNLNRETIYKYAKELEQCGLLKREQSQSEKGKFSHTVYTLLDLTRKGFKPCTAIPVTVETVANKLVPIKGNKNPKKEETADAEANASKQDGNNVPQEEERIVRDWNATDGVKRILQITPQRKKTIQVRLREPFFKNNWQAALKRIAASDFCKGQNDRGWKADFDFFIRPGTLVKIMEGKYDNRVQPKKNNLEGCAP